MVSRTEMEFREHLLRAKQDKFQQIVARTSNIIGMKKPKVIFWNTVCPLDNGNELAHIHLDSYEICVSLLRLKQMTIEQIEDVATHEVTHMIESSHGDEFSTKHSDLKLASWISNKKTKVISSVRENKIKKVIYRCNYHLCNLKKKLKICKYCNERFCERHVTAKLPGLPRFEGSSIEDRVSINE